MLIDAGKKLSVGALVQDDQGRVLLVNPTYKPRWDLPGGIVEAHEDPLKGLAREVREELGVEIKVGELLSVDYGAADWQGREVVMLTFAAEMQSINFVLLDGELAETSWVEVDKALTMVTARMADRLRVALQLVPRGPHGIFVRRPVDPAAESGKLDG